MLYATGHRRSRTIIKRQNSSRQGSRQEPRLNSSTSARPTSARSTTPTRPASAVKNRLQSTSPFFVEDSPPEQKRRSRLLLPSLPLRRMSLPFLRRGKNKKILDNKSVTASTKSKKQQPRAKPEDFLAAERERVDAIRVLIDKEKYDEAFASLLSDTDEDLHYFNQVKREMLGFKHDAAFEKKHGNLKDFMERPAPVEEPNTCIWSGKNDFGNQLRCVNKCLYHPVETVYNHQLGVDKPKQLDFCAYHVKYCVRTSNHAIPVKISVQNADSLCNECYVMRHGEKPKELARVPGTRRYRKQSV